LICQDTDSSRVFQIDSLISLISVDTKTNDKYSNIQESGLIHKKILGVFKKQIGSVSSEIIYHDTLIYCISNIYQYKKDNKRLTEIFHYSDNKLVRYKKELTIQPDSDKAEILKHQILAYFDNYRLIRHFDTINDNFIFNISEQIKVTGLASIEIYNTLESLKVLNNYAPGTPDIKLRKHINE
jgi:hypothetical protein